MISRPACAVPTAPPRQRVQELVRRRRRRRGRRRGQRWASEGGQGGRHGARAWRQQAARPERRDGRGVADVMPAPASTTAERRLLG